MKPLTGGMTMIIKNAHVFIDGEFHDVDVRFDEQKILEIGKQLRGDDIIDAKGNYLYAGFVETHMHGGFRKNFFPHNYDSTGSDWSEDDVRYIVAQLPKYGVTSVIPTLNSLSIEDSCRALRAIRKVRREHAGADPFKIHFEGPYINPNRTASIDASLSALPTKEHTLALTDNDLSDIAIICLAPELPGAEEWCKWITAQGVHVELGYTLCSSLQARECVAWGADTTTHFFNGFETMHQRKEGGIVGCLLEDGLTHQMTCDGMVVSPSWIHLAIKVKGIDNIYGMTDLVHFHGLTEGEYENEHFGPIVVKDDFATTKKNGLILGGINTWDNMMRRARDVVGLDFLQVAKLYGENPCKCLGIHDRGKIEVDRKSDFCLMDKDYNVKKTIIDGKTVYENTK
jgi:N-acetylglucosamine-6-phosphate deacetylase